MGFITNWDSKCCPQPGVGPASGFPLTALICENTILWQGNNLLSAKASSCFHQGGKKKKKKLFSAKPQESCFTTRSRHTPCYRPTWAPTDPPEVRRLGPQNLSSTSAEMHGCTEGKRSMGGNNKKIKTQSPLCHLLYCKHCLLIKGPSQKWMSSLAGRTGARCCLSDHNQLRNTPRELHSHQPAPGWGRMQRQQLPHFPFWSCSQFYKEKSKYIMQSLGTFHITQWLLTAQTTGHCTMTFMLLACQ